MSVDQAALRLSPKVPSASSLVAICAVIAILLPIAYGAGQSHHADSAAFSKPVYPQSASEQSMNIYHASRLDALSRHAFAAAPRPAQLPRPKPSDLRGKRNSAWQQAAAQIAVREGIPAELFLALVFTESSFNPVARSRVGAIGLAQLMPATARELGVDPHDPIENLTGGARYLRAQYERFGSWQLALAAYNAGPGRVRRAGGVPNIRETRNYVQKIITLAALDV